MVFIIFIFVFSEVILRFIFHTSMHVSDEGARFVFTTMTFFGASLVTYRQRHVSLSFFQDFLSGRLKKFLLVFVYLVTVCIIIIFIISAWRLSTQFPSQRTPVLEIPMSWVQFMMVLGGILMAFFFFVQLLEVMTNNTIPSNKKNNK